jgi:hypothetical protein
VDIIIHGEVSAHHLLGGDGAGILGLEGYLVAEDGKFAIDEFEKRAILRKCKND